MTDQPIITARAVAKMFAERAEALGYKPGTKKADNAALDFVCGAAGVARLAGVDLSGLAFVVSIRGAAELLHIASKPE